MVSHGDGGSHLNHRDTAAYLAKRGYIVAAILHPFNNFLDNFEEGTLKNLRTDHARYQKLSTLSLINRGSRRLLT